jgi:hypothetical protein
MQHEIQKSGPLLNTYGGLREPGYAKSLVFEYDRKKIAANGMRIKEWDYYFITNGRYGLALTIADNSYMGFAGVCFLDFEKPWQHGFSKIKWFTRGKTGMPSTSKVGDVIAEGYGYTLYFKNDGISRELRCQVDEFAKGQPLVAKIEIGPEPHESMVIATPFKENERAFYYNQKINCMIAKGYVKLGKQVFVFSEKDTFATLDWGRGVWTYDNTWYWGSASGRVGNDLFGFNIGCGFGDTSAATENMLFFNGIAHKLSEVYFNIPKDENGNDDFMGKWTFTSDDGRFEMEFKPIIDRASKTNFGVLLSDQHQVFGRFTGSAVLDDGRVIKVKDFFGFAEKVRNKW